MRNENRMDSRIITPYCSTAYTLEFEMVERGGFLARLVPDFWEEEQLPRNLVHDVQCWEPQLMRRNPPCIATFNLHQTRGSDNRIFSSRCVLGVAFKVFATRTMAAEP